MASEAIVKQVGAIYIFDVAGIIFQFKPSYFAYRIHLLAEKGKYFIDFKNGSGNVGEGDPGSKPDVTITMNEEVFLKIFNRTLSFKSFKGSGRYAKDCFHYFLGELAPATAFMTGKVKVSGDLSKALTLEKVMKATREAAEANKNKQGWKLHFV